MSTPSRLLIHSTKLYLTLSAGLEGEQGPSLRSILKDAEPLLLIFSDVVQLLLGLALGGEILVLHSSHALGGLREST